MPTKYFDDEPDFETDVDTNPGVPVSATEEEDYIPDVLAEMGYEDEEDKEDEEEDESGDIGYDEDDIDA